MTNAKKFSLVEFAAGGITCKDAPVLYGEIAEQTVVQLWEDKIDGRCSRGFEWGEDEKSKITKAMALRHIFTTTDSDQDKDFPAMIVENKHMPFLRAFVDGINFDHKMLLRIVEISDRQFDFMSLEAAPIRNRISEKVWIEMQHQIAVTGIPNAYCVGKTNHGTLIVKVERDDIFISNHIAECVLFWDKVRKGERPDDVLTKNAQIALGEEALKLQQEIDARTMLYNASKRLMDVTSIKGLPERDMLRAIKRYEGVFCGK